MRFRVQPDWEAQILHSNNEPTYTVFSNNKTGERIRFKGQFGLKVLEGPDAIPAEGEHYINGKWQKTPKT